MQFSHYCIEMLIIVWQKKDNLQTWQY